MTHVTGFNPTSYLCLSGHFCPKPSDIGVKVFYNSCGSILAGMDLGGCYVPDEILRSVFRLLNLNDIRATRQVCRAFNAAASPYLIYSVWISTQPRDWQILQSIAQHDVFSKSVQEICYDVTYYGPNTADRMETYISNRKDSEIKSHFKWVPKCDRASVLRGCDIYRERYKWQQQAISRNLGASTPGNLPHIIDSHSCHSRGDTNGLHIQKSDLESDITHLTQALRSMPGVRTLNISYRRYQPRCLKYKSHYCGFPSCNHRKCRYRRQKGFFLLLDSASKHSDDTRAVVAKPHPYTSPYWASEDFLPIWNRALAVLDLANGATNGEPVTNYSLHVLGGYWNYFDYNDPIHLPKNPKTYYPMFCESLRSISLNLLPVGYMSRFMELGGNGQVQAFLSKAPQLQTLSLAMDPSSKRGFVDLENLLGTRVSQFLRSVHMEGLGFREDHFADFIHRHQGSLTRIELVHVG